MRSKKIMFSTTIEPQHIEKIEYHAKKRNMRINQFVEAMIIEYDEMRKPEACSRNK